MTQRAATAQGWTVRDRVLGTGDVPMLMAVVNATPDSFSDGGQHAGAHAAIAFGLRCIAEGAAIVDVGGESTRPGAQRVDAAEQVARTREVVRALAAQGAVVSVDTTLTEVARAALEAGASIVNDVSAGTESADLFELVAAWRCGLVLMHRVARPGADRYSDEHRVAPLQGDVMAEVCRFLAERAAHAERTGVSRACIALDPGLGFGKTVSQNFELVARLPELLRLGYPVVVGASRKSFVGAVTGVKEPADRVAGSIGVALAAAARGAHVLRVHDVAAHAQALAAWGAAERGGAEQKSSGMP
jgi:dihydropteroate synthase